MCNRIKRYALRQNRHFAPKFDGLRKLHAYLCAQYREIYKMTDLADCRRIRIIVMQKCNRCRKKKSKNRQ